MLPKSFYLLIYGLAFTLTFVLSSLAVASEVKLIQVLKDGENLVDGLDNPRQVLLSADNKFAYVTSGDDNSLAIMAFDKQLKPMQVFKRREPGDIPLEGASSVVSLNNGQAVAVASFYDGSLSIFTKGEHDSYQMSQSFTDGLDFNRVFKRNDIAADEDSFGLLGAWGVAKSADEKQLFVASYKSNAIAVFDVLSDGKITFNRKVPVPAETRSNLGNPVYVEPSISAKELFVAGYESNSITVLARGDLGEFSVQQVIKQGVDGVQNLVNPQKIVQSDAGHLYVASAGSNAISVFKKQKSQYALHQSISNTELGGFGLTGVASIAITNSGEYLFSGAEQDIGLNQFKILPDGSLQPLKTIQLLTEKIAGVTSIAITADDKYLLVTLGKKDAIYLLQIN